MANGWIVARTKSGRERWAAENVSNQGYEWYLPRISRTVHRKGGFSFTRAEPLFHCYLFVKTSGPWQFLLGTFGISSVVTFDQSPPILPQIEIDKLKAAEVAGIIQLKDRQENSRPFTAGMSLRVKGGVFSGYIGIHKGMQAKDRERVLFDFLGRKTTVILATELLEAA